MNSITDKIKPIRGIVQIELWEEGKKVQEIILENAVTEAARNSIRRALAGEAYHIDQIKVYNDLVLLATSTSVETDFTLTDTVTFTAVFEESSFNGVFDELNLCVSYDTSIFSILTALNITKTNLQKMAIRWKLKITS